MSYLIVHVQIILEFLYARVYYQFFRKLRLVDQFHREIVCGDIERNVCVAS